MTRRYFPVALLLLAFVSACRSASSAATIPACFLTGNEKVPVLLEVANTPEHRRLGLMQRTHLPENRGMWFLYQVERRGDQGFWMYRTVIPLDIAFLDRDGVVLRIVTMEPCPASDSIHCPTYAPGLPYWSAVEMNAGFYRTHGISVGARLSADETLCRS